MSNSSQILALDSRYNAYRTPNSPGFKTLYIRRRSQLLRENGKKLVDPQIRKNYLKLRSQILSDRYGPVPSEGSIKSRSLSQTGMSNSRLTLLDSDFNDSTSKSQILPTSQAEASRALVGNTTIGENYSFAGVHHIFDQHNDSVVRLQFAHDESSRLGVASMDGVVSVCHVSEETGKSTVITKLQGHSLGVTDFAWSVSNDLIVSCSLDCTVRVWNTSSGECIRIADDNHPVNCCAFQPLNNNLVVTGNAKGLIQVLNISTGKYIKTGGSKTVGAALCLCCDNAGRLLWVGDDKGHISSFILDVNSGKLIKGRRILVCAGHAVTSISSRAWVSRESRDPFLLVNTCIDALFLYKVIGNDGNLSLYKRFPIKQAQQRIRSSFCPLMSFRQGACVLSGSEDGSVYLFDIERDSKHCVNKLLGHAHPVLDVTFNHDESLLASGDTKGQVIIWKREKKRAS